MVSRLPRRLRRYLTTFPEEAGLLSVRKRNVEHATGRPLCFGSGFLDERYGILPGRNER